MSSNTTSLENPKLSAWFGGNQPLNASYGKLMMWFFLLSDAFTFSAFLIGYGMIRFRHPVYEGKAADFIASDTYWPIPEKIFNAFPFFHGVDLPLVFVGLMTFILIVSSVTMVLAVEAGHRRDRKDVEKWMIWTVFGGICFVGCQAWEWSHFITGSDNGSVRTVWDYMTNSWQEKTIFGANMKINEYGPTAFADLFFFITGFHGIHVVSGIILNILVFHNASFGIYEKRGHYEMIEKVGLYWHFVDLVWVFVFTFFYLV